MKARSVFLAGAAFLLSSLPLHAQGTATFRSRPQGQPTFQGHRFQRTYRGVRTQALPQRVLTSQALFSSRLYPNVPGRSFWRWRDFRRFSPLLGRYTYWPVYGFGGPFPVFGLGFDAYHYTVLNRWRRVGFYNDFYNNPYNDFYNRPWSWFPVFASSVVVAPQVVPVGVPVAVPVEVQERRPVEVVAPAAERLVGTPRAEERIRVVAPSITVEETPLARLTLLVFKDHSIYGVTDYWLEAGQLHYVTSYGARNAVTLDQLDLEMTAQLNRERNVEFTLRPEPSTR